MGKEISRIYPIFIDAFQEAVAEKQKEISQMEKSQTEYMIVRECISETDKNAFHAAKLKLSSVGVLVDIVLTEGNDFHDLLNFIRRIGKKLQLKNLHISETGIPSLSSTTSYKIDLRFVWRTKRKKDEVPGSVFVSVTSTVPISEAEKYIKNIKIRETIHEFPATEAYTVTSKAVCQETALEFLKFS